MSEQKPAFVHQPFQGIATFGHQPYCPDPAEADVMILGVPFDGTVSGRSGTRLGPRAIRDQSLCLWGYNNALQVAPFEQLRVVDGGDVEVIPPDVVRTHNNVQTAAERVLDAGCMLITLGGEHSISLPLLRAHAAKHGPLAMIQFDAHPDLWDEEYPGLKFSHGTPFRRALEEGLIDPTAFVQIGIRGPTGGPQDYEDVRQSGALMFTADEIDKRGIDGILRGARQRIGDRPVYVTFDIDVADPAYAPGTGTPEVGGFTSRELLRLVRGLRGLNFTGFDLVEVSPAYDSSGITALLGANLVFEFLSLLAVR
ncbi:MAG: agmatinase [Rhodopirellula sp.]|nr:agmatinase [Rhodopirellula sp.]